MMISDETRAFVAAHRDEDVRELALHAGRPDGVDLTVALEQIAGWQTARTKLPDWAAHDDVWYPPHLSMEQCSSEFTARYKADLARRLVGGSMCSGAQGTPGHSFSNGCVCPDATGTGMADTDAPRVDAVGARPFPATLVDLTGGFGVDFSYMARAFDRAVYVERQPHLCAIAEHNMPALGLPHAEVVNADAEDFLDAMPEATLVFLDPARRDAHGARTYAIADCTPDVLGMLDRLLAKAPHVMVKLSPMLDWHKTVDDFAGHVSEVHIVSTGNECKELLLVVARDVHAEPRVTCVNDAQRFVFGAPGTPGTSDSAVSDVSASIRPRQTSDTAGSDALGAVSGSQTSDSAVSGVSEAVSGSRTSVPIGSATVEAGCDRRTAHSAGSEARLLPDARYLYEPNASIMKAGCFDELSACFGVRRIGANSHLFVSSEPVADFPGRSFVIERIATMNRKELKTALNGLTHANIATRNFPLPVAALRRKLKLKDGGDVYLFATTDAHGRHLVIRCRKA
ncbi:THUMP-like domain-containing protein [Bifidobacterium santillanense]|uniref:class I SAM-dependent methyltransferase n=1 Tax=Bifidobacterium santillanense TaxID=2809028 RepID=UPI003B84568F